MDGTDGDAAARRALALVAGLEVDPADPADVFELQQAEGAGASGRVFRACQRSDPSVVVALKVIPIPPVVCSADPSSSCSPASSPSSSAAAAASPPAAVAAVAREIAFLRACDHPNVVAFRGAYYKSGALWLAMEHCAGGSAASVRARGPLTERQIAVVLRGALRGLAYLHARRKLHRDVKGANILLTQAGCVKLADFGVSAQLSGTDSSLLAAADAQGADGRASDAQGADGGDDGGDAPAFQRATFVGTPYWMSPEMIQDGAYDHKADIWSLGVTAIELADREPPLFREHPMRALLQIPRNEPPTVREPRRWSADFLAFLRFVLRKNPRERPSAAECLRHPFLQRDEPDDSVFEDAKALADGDGHCQDDRNQEADKRGELTADADAQVDSQADAQADAQVDAQADAQADAARCQHQRVTSPADATAESPPPTDSVVLSPTRADSPVRRSRAPRGVVASAVDDRQCSTSALSELSLELHDPIREAPALSSPSVCSSLNPLAQIDASVAGVRVSALLASLSGSSASSLLSSGSISESADYRRALDSSLPAALLSRSSAGLSLSTSFREALTHSRSNSVADLSVSATNPPLTWRELQPRQFGVSLDDQQPVGDASVPTLLHLLRHELLARDALRSTSWIYRASPNACELERARSAINRGAVFDSSSVTDSNVFTSLLKLWLRELPAPLLSPVSSSHAKRLAQLVTSGDTEGSPTRLPLATVHELVERALEGVRGRRRAVLEWLLDHWLEVLRFGSTNRMTAQALAVVMAPSVYRCGHGAGERGGGDVTVADVIAMLRLLIYWRRACRDTGIVHVVSRLEDAQLESSDRRRGAEETTPNVGASLVWPISGKCSASRVTHEARAAVGSSEIHLALDKALQECVSRAARFPDQGESGDNDLEALESERFVTFQRSVAAALASAAKTPEEVAFAHRFRSLQRHRSELSTLSTHHHAMPSEAWEQLRRELPVAVRCMERWLGAAVSVGEFRAMVRREREVSDKRQRLYELQVDRSAAAAPLSDHPDVAAFSPRIVATGGFLDTFSRRLAGSRRRLVTAAQWFARMRGDGNGEEDVEALVALGHAKPLVGLVLLAQLDQAATPSA